MPAAAPHPLDLTDDLRAALHAAAQACYPRECCGLVIRRPGVAAAEYWPCRNTLAAELAQDRFVLAPEDYAAAEDAGEVLAVVHSHPNASANPSSADRVCCEHSGLPWLIVGWPSGVVVQLLPEGWEAPLVGREFAFGVLDCYTLIQDYFRRELGLELPDFEREDGFWERRQDAQGVFQPGEELYLNGFEAAGFVPVDGEPRRHDVILMQVASDVVNHGAVYLGDGTILHHIYGRLSCRDPYGGTWQRHTRLVVRHRALLEAA